MNIVSGLVARMTGSARRNTGIIVHCARYLFANQIYGLFLVAVQGGTDGSGAFK